MFKLAQLLTICSLTTPLLTVTTTNQSELDDLRQENQELKTTIESLEEELQQVTKESASMDEENSSDLLEMSTWGQIAPDVFMRIKDVGIGVPLSKYTETTFEQTALLIIEIDNQSEDEFKLNPRSQRDGVSVYDNQRNQGVLDKMNKSIVVDAGMKATGECLVAYERDLPLTVICHDVRWVIEKE